MVTKAIFRRVFITRIVEFCDKMLFLFSKILADLCGVAPHAQTWERSLQKIRRTVTSLLFLTESGPDEALEGKLSSLCS